MRQYTRNFFRHAAHKSKDVTLEFHTHVDAVGVLSSNALEDLLSLGFEAYNFDYVRGSPLDITHSDLVVRTGKNREKEECIFVLNYKTGDISEALQKGEESCNILKRHKAKGYLEIEQVYNLPLSNKAFNQDRFNHYFPEISNERPLSAILNGRRRALPFKAQKGPLAMFNDIAHGQPQLRGDFSAGEIHLTMPRTINKQVASNQGLIEALFAIGFYGPDVPKYMKNSSGELIYCSESGYPQTLIDMPLTVSASNMRVLRTFTNATTRMIEDIGWSDNSALTSSYPFQLKFEIMLGHHWFDVSDPSSIYRDVLYDTLFDPQQKNILTESRRGKVAGYSLSSASCL